MPFKPVGVDENGHFPPRVRQALADTFVTKPDGIGNGQVPVWDATTETWVPGFAPVPSSIDGGPPG